MAVSAALGFIALSAEGKTLLSWQPAVGAISYSVWRSTDNVSFSSIATTTLTDYIDTPPVVGTIYYYKIRATDGALTADTAAIAAKGLLVGQTTLGNLRTLSQQRCDRLNSTFITKTEWNMMIMGSYKRLYDLLAQKFGNDYYVATPYTYTTDGTSITYALPAAFYKLLGLELSSNPTDANSWVTLRKFEFAQRNFWHAPNVSTFHGVTSLRYRLSGSNLLFNRIPAAAQTVRAWYIPRPSQPINDTDVIDGVSGWEEFIINDCAGLAMVKEESDPSAFFALRQKEEDRIETAAENRDAGEPETVSDTKGRAFGWDEGEGDVW